MTLFSSLQKRRNRNGDYLSSRTVSSRFNGLRLAFCLAAASLGAPIFAAPSMSALPPGVSAAAKTRADDLIDRGARLYLQKRYVEALSVCRQATLIAPLYARSYVGLGTIYTALNQREAAGRAYRRALALRADTDDAARARAGLRKLGLPQKGPASSLPFAINSLNLPRRAALQIASFRARSTIVVAPDGEFQTLGEAIARAIPYTRIEVRAGTYRENLVIDKPLQIVGESAATTIIESTDAPVFSLRASRVALAKMTIQARVSSPDKNRFHALEIALGQVTIDACKVLSESRVAVAVYGDDTAAIVRNSQIEGARTSGFLIYRGARLDLVNSSVSGAGFAAMEVVEQGNVFARTSTLSNNRGGVIVQKDGFVLLQNSAVKSNSWEGVRVKSQGALVLSQTPVTQNRSNFAIEKGGILRRR